MRNVLDFIFFMIEGVIFWGYCNKCFSPVHKKIKKLIFVQLGFIPLFFVFLLRLFILNGLCIFAIIFLLILFIYKQSALIALIHGLLFLNFVIISEYFLITIGSVIFGISFSSFLNNPLYYFIANIISKLLIGLMGYFIARLYEKYNTKNDNTGYILISVVIVFDFVMFAVIQIFTSNTVPDTKMYLLWAGSTVLSYFLIYVVFYYRNYMLKQSQKIDEYAKKQFDEQYYALVEKSNRDMQILSHDFKNHLIQLDTAENMEQVHKYIKTMYPTIQQFHSVNVSENKTLNTIISKYNSLCAVKGIDFKYEISASLSFLENNDLTAILGNLLDNALESAEKCAEKRIALSIYSKNEKTTVLRITNTCERAPVVKKGKLQTTKTDDAPHGLGLKSVESTVKKYGGFYEWEYIENEKQFVTVVSVYHSERKENL